MDGSQKQQAERKEPDTEGCYYVCDSLWRPGETRSSQYWQKVGQWKPGARGGGADSLGSSTRESLGDRNVSMS